MKTFTNGKKVPIIPPLLVNDKHVSTFVEICNAFNDFFSRQCQPVSNDSTFRSTFSFETANRLSTVNIRPEKISEIVQILDQNKVHGQDDIIKPSSGYIKIV